jgi:hypothetical protein
MLREWNEMEGNEQRQKRNVNIVHKSESQIKGNNKQRRERITVESEL